MSEKKGLVPRLRFPEFREAGEWDLKKLGDKDVASFVTTRISLGKLTIDTYISTENISPDFGGITSASKLPSSGSFTAYEEGDILIANIRPYLKKVWLANRSGGASNDVVVVRSRASIKNTYLSSILKSERFIAYVMKGAKGVKMPRGDISLMKEYPLAIPNPDEQQRIADCLSSLDALIAAQADKLDVLKTHKNGLMQQLFPREGETVPRLRFPEFWDAGEWKQKLLGRLSNIVRGGSPRPIDNFITRNANGLNWLKIGDVDKEAKYVTHTKERVIQAALSKTREVKPGDLIMSNSMSFGRPYILKIDSCIHDGWIAVTTIADFVDSDYLYYLILSNPSQTYFLNAAAGGGVKNLNADIIKLLPVKYPNIDEQQKIAACLSSLDALIAAQADKLEALKTHKKGLMQQLFPKASAAPTESTP